MRLAFIIVRTERTPKRLLATLIKDIKAMKRRNGEIIIITNQSGVQGYAEGVNKGIREAEKDAPDFFFIMNPDIRLDGMTGDDLIAPASVFDIWGFAMKQGSAKYYRGTIDRWRLSAGLSGAKPGERYVESPFVSGSFMCVKRDVIKKIGLFDEGFFMYYEDVDYCRRALRNGFKVGVDTGVVYTHYESSQDYPEKKRWLARSRLRYFLRYANQLQQLYELVRLPKTLFEERDLLFSGLKKRPFLTNFLTLNASSAINKVLTFVLFVFLVRKLTPADYGLYTLAWAHLGLTMPLADFGTTSYGIIRFSKKSSENFSDMYTLRWILGTVFIVVTLILALIFRFNQTALSLVMLLIPAMLFNIVSGSLLIVTASRSRTYVSSLVSIATNAFLIAALVILMTSIPAERLIVPIFIVTAICYAAFTFITLAVLRTQTGALKFTIDPPKLVRLMRKSSVFVLLSFAAGLYFKADVIILNMIKGSEAVGIYTSGYKFFEALIFISASYTIAATPVFAKLLKHNIREFSRKLYRDAVLMFLLGAAVAGLGVVAAPLLLSHILKDQYAGALPVFRIVMVALPFLFASTVIMNAFYIVKKTPYIVWLFVVQAAFNGALNAALIPIYSYTASAYITVVTELLTFAILVGLFSSRWDVWKRDPALQS